MRQQHDLMEPATSSSEADAGARKENASNKNPEPRSDSIGTEMALE